MTTVGSVSISRKTEKPGIVPSGVEPVRWRHLGRDVPEELAREETASAWLVEELPMS
jgi:hypothetical protein